MRIRSFKFKLIFSYLFVVVLSFGFVTFFLETKLTQQSLNNIETSLVNQAYLISDQIIAEDITNAATGRLEPLVLSLSAKIKCRITVIDRSGKVLADSDKSLESIPQMENHLYRPEVKIALADGIGIDKRYSLTLDRQMLYVALPLKGKTEILGVLRLALSLESVEKILSQTRKTVLAGLAFALLLAFVFGSIIAGQTIRPINRMITVSRKFSEGDFSRRVLVSSQDEVGELAQTLNKMAQGLEDKIKEVKAQNQRLAAVFSSMIEGVIVVNKDSSIISVNPTVEDIFNVSRKDVEGKTFLEAIRNSEIAEIINSVLKKGISVSGEISLILPVRKTFEVSATAIFDNQKVEGCLVVIHDITEMRKLETIRRDFVANVSHELKTPLTSIKGFVETLLEGALEDKENNRNFLRIIQDHTERLNSLVEDLLALAHLESKEISLNRSSFDLRLLLEEVASGFGAPLKKSGIELKNEIAGGILINADQNRIKQVFTNLIDNAIKFNKENGLIRISAEQLNSEVKVWIEDSGIGIPEKDLPRIFERFYRVDKGRSRALGGTGLGLSIVKHIVELHGGSVGVESTEAVGSRFWFILPR